ncbi:MAG: hypothetical protein IPK82_00270 [Polyangiaceae bacterium]|nr:hypothetical protein [Polyangiaceae bacterium]
MQLPSKQIWCRLPIYTVFAAVLPLVGCDPGGGSTNSGGGGVGGIVTGGGGTGGAGTAGSGAAVSTGGAIEPGADTTIVAYAGGSGAERFEAALGLSDGTFLFAGSADNLDFVPPETPKVEIAAGTINSASPTKIGFILHASGDLQTVLHLVHFPVGTVRDISRLRLTGKPGAPSGDLFISGRRDVTDKSNDGYFIARLDHNFISGVPSKALWTFDAKCPPREAGGGTGESAYKTIQPWDVGSDGRVVYGEGAEYDFKWAQIQRLSPEGKPEVVENFTAHWSDSTEWDGTPASSYQGGTLVRSAIVMKAGRRGSLRSATQEDFDALLPDGNGRTDRKGRYPDDYYFSGPCSLVNNTCPGGPGYTGYKTSDKPTQRVGAIAIDRDSGDFYVGYSTQSTLPDGNPDFEPAVAALDKTGKLKWWSRLYHERTDKDGGGFNETSSPDQYVDHLAVDHTGKTLVVLARAHGNNVINYWSGDKVAANPGAKSFHSQFTGSSGNIHISWVGKLSLSNGVLQAASWNAEYAEGTGSLGAPYDDPNLDGWPSHNAGWPDLNTTRVASLAVDADGRVYLTAVGRRTITTKTAYQKMPKPNEGMSGWNDYVRVFAPDLSTLVYSSILRGPWDTSMDGGGGNISLIGVVPAKEGVLAVGFHGYDEVTMTPAGVPMPVSNVPAWCEAEPQGESAVLAHLLFSP